MRIVDAHVHVWDADAVPIPWFAAVGGVGAVAAVGAFVIVGMAAHGKEFVTGGPDWTVPATGQ